MPDVFQLLIVRLPELQRSSDSRKSFMPINQSQKFFRRIYPSTKKIHTAVLRVSIMNNYNEITLLLTSKNSSKDDCEKDVVPPRPLSFDRVNEGKAPVSETLFFTLPFEIVGQIVEILPRSSLASLALVCRDCRQLARSRQFASIKLDYSNHSVALVEKLMAEATARLGSFGSSNNISQSLGVCIRRITVATDPNWLGVRHNIDLESDQLALSVRTRVRRLANASKHIFDDYLPKIRILLCSNIVLPHLESLDWRDKITLPQSFFQRLPWTSIQHLRLSSIKVSEVFEINLPKAFNCWPLRTLHLELLSDVHAGRPSISLVCASILRLCALTLESLTWHALTLESWTWQILQLNDDNHSFATQTIGLAPHFPRLRSLSLHNVAFSDYSMLDALLE